MVDPERRPFAITLSPERVELGAERRGTVSFTVTSNVGVLRARAIVVPGERAQKEWFEISGPAERRLDRTEQIAVKIAVPADTPAGDYGFHLKVVSEERPDEVFTDSSAVAIAVPSSVAPKKPFPWWIVAVAAGGLVVVAVTAWHLWPESSAALGEPCGAEAACGDELTCDEQRGVCVGELHFAGCENDGDCAAGLLCQETAPATRVCLGGLLFEGCRNEDDCGLGLGCDGETCLGEDGQPCDPANPADQCLADLLCFQGKCSADTVFQECRLPEQPCMQGQQCLTLTDDERLCLRSVDQACSNSLECVTRLCQGGTCRAKQDGEGCTADLECTSRVCWRDGTCRTFGCTAHRPCPVPPGRQMRCDHGTCRWSRLRFDFGITTLNELRAEHRRRLRTR